MIEKEHIATLGNDKPSHAIADGGLSDVLNSSYGKVKILQRFPASGMPAEGAPFSVKIEVETYRDASNWRTPFTCLDAFVVVRGLYQYQNKILGSSFVHTSAISLCTGQATIQLSPEFRPGPKDWVQFEIYPGGSTEWFSDKTTLQMVKNGDVEMVGKSQPMRFNSSQQELKESGVITEPESIFGSTNNATIFGGLQNTIGSLTTLLVVGGGAYLVWKNGDAIKEMFEEFADEISDEGLNTAVQKRVKKGKKKLSSGLSKAQQKLDQ